MTARRVLARNLTALKPHTPLNRGASLATRATTSVSSGSCLRTPIRSLHATSRQLAASTTSAVSTAEEYPTSHAPIASVTDTTNFIDNEFVSSQATKWIDLHDPATNNLVTRVPQSTDAELLAAVDSAQKAFPAWAATSLLHRQQIMFKYVALIRKHWDRLAASITLEQGKTFADAKGDVLRGLQVAETACGITTQMMGEIMEVAKDMETRTYKEPLGVVGAICPFSKLTVLIPTQLSNWKRWRC
jgi:malonate-semialdehyde dehydrogenase (acetylating) / methylmalonate-semialdehyde dehydrogenase